MPRCQVFAKIDLLYYLRALGTAEEPFAVQWQLCRFGYRCEVWPFWKLRVFPTLVCRLTVGRACRARLSVTRDFSCDKWFSWWGDLYRSPSLKIRYADLSSCVSAASYLHRCARPFVTSVLASPCLTYRFIGRLSATSTSVHFGAFHPWTRPSSNLIDPRSAPFACPVYLWLTLASR